MATDSAIRHDIDRGERLKLRLGTIAWFLALIGLLLGLPVLLDLGWWALAAAIALALLLALPIWWLVRRLFARQRLRRWISGYAATTLAVVSVITVAIATPLYGLAVSTAVQPLTVPQVSLTDGSKTVIFQGMVHVGSEGFFKSVVYDVEKALSEGYVIYYEGVTGDPAGDAWFSENLAGGGDLSANYSKLGDACGLKFQLNYFGLLRQDMVEHPERHIAADVSTADMMHEYERLAAADPTFAARATAAKGDDSQGEGDGIAAVFNWLENATPGQRALVGVACRAIMTRTLSAKTEPSALDPVILDFRNRELAKRIESGPDKIYITYGAGHLPGLLEDLRALNPAWEVGSVKWMRAIEAPDDLEGEI